jgi:hypothetical protein
MAEEKFLPLFNSWVPRKAGKGRHSQICEKNNYHWTLLCSINTVTMVAENTFLINKADSMMRTILLDLYITALVGNLL